MLSLLLVVPSCSCSFGHGVIPTSYFIFNDFCTCIQWNLQLIGQLSIIEKWSSIGSKMYCHYNTLVHQKVFKWSKVPLSTITLPCHVPLPLFPLPHSPLSPCPASLSSASPPSLSHLLPYYVPLPPLTAALPSPLSHR